MRTVGPPTQPSCSRVTFQQKETKPIVLDDDSKKEDEDEDETRLALDGVDGITVVYDNKCQVCKNDPCLFTANEDGLIDYDEAKHVHLAREDRPANNLRRKKLHCQLTSMINGGPMVAGVRKPSPDCCVGHIREMLPSESFMGHRSEQCHRHPVISETDYVEKN
jgi:hypothetical protein